MKLTLDNINSKHYAWLRQMAKALNFTIVDVELSKEEVSLVEDAETSYLLSTEANKKHLEESIRQADEGKTQPVDTEKLWK